MTVLVAARINKIVAPMTEAMPKQRLADSRNAFPPKSTFCCRGDMVGLLPPTTVGDAVGEPYEPNPNAAGGVYNHVGIVPVPENLNTMV